MIRRDKMQNDTPSLKRDYVFLLTFSAIIRTASLEHATTWA